MTPPPSLHDLINTVRQDAPTENALDQLVTAAETVAQLEDTSDALLGHFVDRCRREGRSWSEISGALGVTKQAAHKRFATAMADQIIASVPSPTLERFTDRARRVLAAASRMALADGEQKASSAYLLLGLFTEPDGLAAKALYQMGVSRKAIDAAVQAAATEAGKAAAEGTAEATEIDGGSEPAAEAPQMFTADGRRALRDALAVALELGHNYIGTEHLLLGFYRDPGSPAALILAAVGAPESEVTAHVTEMLHGFRQPPTA